MSKIEVSKQWETYKKQCEEIALLSAQLPYNKSDPFHEQRLLTHLRLEIENVFDVEDYVRKAYRAITPKEFGSAKLFFEHQKHYTPKILIWKQAEL